MSKALKKDATYADLCAVPDNFVAEILGGELYASPRPAFPHARAAGVLSGVGHVRLVDPLQQTLEVLRLEAHASPCSA